jgi:predicted deacylase
VILAAAVGASLLSPLVLGGSGPRIPPVRPATAALPLAALRDAGRSKRLPGSDASAWRPIGWSVLGRPILVATFGSGRRRVLVVGGFHGNEYGANLAERLASYLRAHPTAVPSGTRVDVVGCLNPDGRAAGTRANANGVDLNRNLPSSSWAPLVWRRCSAGARPGSEPETAALLSLLGQGYSRVISLHSAGGLVDYDGPGARRLAATVAAAWHMPVVYLAAQHHYTGTLGQYVPERYRIPVITVELLHPRLSSRALAGLLAAVR